jgi:LPS-assembly lipoprotein
LQTSLKALQPARYGVGFAGYSLLASLVLLLAGCGFQLRGSFDLPPEWERLALATGSPNGELAREVRDGAARAGVEWLPRNEANYVVFLGQEQFERRNRTIGATARASEFELEMRTTLRIMDSSGQELLAETEFDTLRVITNDPNNITGKAGEVELVRREMRQALARQLLQQLRFLAENPQASAPAS